MNSIMYPALQKFYSALKNLDKFNKENDFFSNISSLDTFFSEFRNITFVLQKSVAKSDQKKIYEEQRDLYLSDCKWFVDKRNEITKEAPFSLVKKISVTVYFSNCEIPIVSKSFTVENDIPLTKHLNSLKSLFSQIDENEVFFSAEFSFYDKKTNEDLYDKLILGIQKMNSFLNAMYIELGEKSKLCDQLLKEISKFKFSTFPKDFLFVNDYIYYTNNNSFESGDRMAAVIISNNQRVPLKALSKAYGDFRGDYFRDFIIMHALIGTTDLMPTIMRVYNDDTYTIDTFHSSIKTTMYRKLNELSKEIEQGEIKEVYLMLTYTTFFEMPFVNALTSKQRLAMSSNEQLTFVKVDNMGIAYECSFDKNQLNDKICIAKTLSNSIPQGVVFGANNTKPIIRAFMKINNKQS